jgi:hypothetical protein
MRGQVCGWMPLGHHAVFSSQRRRIPRGMARIAMWPERWKSTRVVARLPLRHKNSYQRDRRLLLKTTYRLSEL